MQTFAFPAEGAPPTSALPVHPRRAGWRAGAAAALVTAAVSELRSGRSPQADVHALSQLGGGDLPPGLAAAEELDRRLATVQSLLSGDPSEVDEHLDALVQTLFEGLGPEVVDGFPHPGEWVASSVDVVPCAVHGYEDGVLDCLRLCVRAHLAAVTGTAGPGAAAQLGAQVRATAALPHDDALGGGVAVRLLWTGVAAVAAWQAYAATR